MSSTYPVALFNDIHRYFPAILYEPERFNNVGELLQYIRNQVRIHSDPYVHGLQTYNTTQRQSRPSTPSPPRRYQYPPVGVQTTNTPPPTARGATRVPVPMSVVFEANSGTGLNPFDSITGSMLRELLIPGSSLLGAVNELIGAPHQNTMEPVPVRPTAQQIATASTVSTVSAEQEDEATEENTCAICQDVMAEGSQVRTLNSCEHAFHIGCIDTWFQRHVNCPVCRHDIREA